MNSWLLGEAEKATSPQRSHEHNRGHDWTNLPSQISTNAGYLDGLAFYETIEAEEMDKVTRKLNILQRSDSGIKTDKK
jgi:hypothetical protein